MKRILSVPVIVSLISLPSQLHAGDSVNDRITQGIEQLYNVSFDDAAKSFDQAIAAAPRDPRGYFFRASVHLWSYLFDRRQDQLALYMSLSDKAISVAQARLRSNGSDASAKLFLGLSYGYKAIANARAENIMAAALAAKTCYTQLNEVVATDPKMYDAYLGLGIFHFIFGSVPKAGQFLAGIGGIKGDAKLGLREIEAAARRGGYFRNDAQLILALLNIYYNNSIDQGLASLDAMAKRYPKNVAILYALGSVYLDQKQPDKAVSYFDRVAQQGNNDFRTFTNMSYGRAGMAFFMKNDFAKAKTYLQKFLRYSDEKMFRAFAWFLLGECYEIEGNREYAVKAYQRALKSPQYSSPEDRYAFRKAKEWIARPMTAADIDILRALNFNAAGAREQAVSLSRSALARTGTTPAQRAQAYYALGEALQAKADYRGAIDAFTNAVRAGKHDEDWVAPYSYFHIAESYLKLGDREKWRENLNRAQDFHGYDNEPQLRFKISRDVTLID